MGRELVDCTGRRRSPAAMPGHYRGHAPPNKGRRYPADPPSVEEIVRVMRTAGPGPNGDRLRGMIVVLWRAGLRISEALALAESDLDPARGAILVRRGKGGKRREVGMDGWAWQQLEPWLRLREQLPVGTLFCTISGPTRGGPGHPKVSACSCAQQRSARVSGGASRRTSYATPTPSRWRTKASRWSSSNASSDTSTSASPRSTYKASTTPKSSTPSTTEPHPSSPRAQDSTWRPDRLRNPKLRLSAVVHRGLTELISAADKFGKVVWWTRSRTLTRRELAQSRPR